MVGTRAEVMLGANPGFGPRSGPPSAMSTTCRSVLPPRRRLRLAPDTPPFLLVQVHTEEEFDWDAPFDREAVATTAFGELARLQALFERHGVTPTYAVDWPVLANPEATAALLDWRSRRVAEVGAHLHPWVTPPHDEQLSAHNSFAGNLPAELERAKLARLTDRIEQCVGARPCTFVAGRYGIGARTPVYLAELGYRVDGSATPPFDYRAEGGPDFSRFPTSPYWHETEPVVLGLPVTGGFVGALRGVGARLYPLLRRAPARRLRLEAVSSRMGLLERVRLSPEGFSLDEMKGLVRRLLRDGERVFSLSMHSTSLLPGATSYSASDADVVALLGRVDGLLAWFRDELRGVFEAHSTMVGRLESTTAA